mmetsp:Transcript_55055/g.128814  ORF Transcript_55055/g.128814 Transcript_55055/m.128814 type:complete len:231 (-) Transcript_55055:94-786(-)
MSMVSWPSHSEASEAGDWTPQLFCIPEQFFQGCTMCNVSDNEFKPRARFAKLQAVNGSDYDDPDDNEEETELEFENDKLKGVASEADYAEATTELHMELEVLEGVLATHGWSVRHTTGDHWDVNGRDVRVYLLPRGIPKPSVRHIENRFPREVAQQAARIMVSDGPLLQPILDYLLATGQNEHYDHRGTSNPAAVRGFGRNLEFAGMPSDRLEAMRMASLEHSFRREADH